MNTASLETVIIKKRYKIIKTLGTGGMGSVYLAHDLEKDMSVSIKEMHKISDPVERAKDIGQFGKEAKFLTKLSHPNLPRLYEFFFEDARPYLVMEYIEGKTLEEIMTSSKEPVPVNKAVSLIIEIADIMAYLHNSFETPLVYRDLKPSNIIITPRGNAKLIDFGIARYYTPGKNTDTFRFGTPGYAAPEQHKHRGQSGPQTDIFGLGVILYQMVTKYDPTVTPFIFPPMKPLNPHVDGEL